MRLPSLPLLSSGRVRGPSSSPEVATFHLHPAGRTLVDPDLLLAHRLEREEAVRALHALGMPFAIDLEVLPHGHSSLDLIVPRKFRGTAARILGPRMSPWAWTEGPTMPLRLSHADRGQLLVGAICRGRGSSTGRAPPLRSSRSEKDVSPWTLLIPALKEPGWSLRVRWIAVPVGPSHAATLLPIPQLPRGDRETPLPRPPAHHLEREMEDLRAERAVGPFWACAGGLLAVPERGTEDLRERARSLRALWRSLSGLPGGTGFELRWKPRVKGQEMWLRALSHWDPWGGWRGRLGIGDGPMHLSPSELLLWLPPWDARRTPGLHVRGEPPRSGIPLGHDEAGEPVLWEVAPREGHHATVAGETGMGKSTLLQRLSARLALSGAAVVVIDPLGETARGLLELLPETSRSRAVWISPLRSPVGINALALPDGPQGLDARAERERRVSELVTALRRVRAERYGDTVYWGPRIEDLLTRTLLTLSSCPGATLLDAAELLSDPEHWIGPIPSPSEGVRETQALWESIRREGPEDRQGALRVVQEVALSSSISRVLASRAPRWSLDRALVPGAVTLFDLERRSVGVRASSYLGAALLSLLWSFLLARKDQGKVVLLLDEVQEYASDALAEMLRLGRRYNLHVLAATQSLSTLQDPLREALVTNSRDLFFFRGSAADARLAREGLGVGRDQDLASLPRGTLLALLEKGTHIVRVRTEAPLARAARTGASPDQLYLACIERSRAFWSSEDGDEDGSAPRSPNSPSPPAPSSPSSAGSAEALKGATAHPSAEERRGPSEGHPPPAGPSTGPTESDRGLSLPLLALLVASLEAPEGEPFAVPVGRVRALCGQDERLLRRLGTALKGSGALLRTERQDGERVWWLSREGLTERAPSPWDPAALTRAREAWERSSPAPAGGGDQAS